MRSVLAYKFNCFTHHLDCHIIQQHHIGIAFHSFLYLSERFTLNLYFEQVRSNPSCSSNSLCNPSRSLDMIIFNQYPIAQTKTMVQPTAQLDRHLLQAAQSTGGLACVDDTGSFTL